MLPAFTQAIVLTSTSIVTTNGSSYTATTTVNASITTTANIEFFRYVKTTAATNKSEYVTATLCDFGSGFVAMSSPTSFAGTFINVPATLAMLKTDVFKSGETMFLRIDDFDKNSDDTVIDTVDITLSVATTSDSEIIRLNETGVNSGVFTGYIKLSLLATTKDCVLSVAANSQITANYLDNINGTGPVIANALVDPFGVIFNSADGAPLDGIEISLIDVATDLPAIVFGDDGSSRYPATVITGSDVTDGGGAVYAFPPGNYRFPFVAAGTYRFDVTVPATYVMPSVVVKGDLQSLVGAPYSLVVGSRGENFTVITGPVINIDIPIDPPEFILYVSILSARSRASVGDYIPYHLQLTNNGITDIANVTLSNILPIGLRYQSGSVTINDKPVIDPSISANGRILQFSFEQFMGSSSMKIDYVASVNSNVKMGDVKNTAAATSDAGLRSNSASTMVEIWDDLMRMRSQIAGRVFLNHCAMNSASNISEVSTGVAEIRLIMEDGRSVHTDERGMYHFEQVRPGNHVVQIDPDSLPEQMEIVSCGGSSRIAGTSHSQFVDVRGGLLVRADFYVQKKLIRKPNAATAIQFQSQLNKIRGEVLYQIDIHGREILAKHRVIEVNIPRDLVLISGSASLDGKPIADPQIQDSRLLFNLGNGRTEDWQHRIRFLTQINNITGEALVSWVVMRFNSKLQGEQSTNKVRNQLDYSIYGSDRVVYRTEYAGHGLDISIPERRRLDTVIRYLKNRSFRHIRIAAYTDNLGIPKLLQQTFQENNQLSLVRARQVRDIVLEGLDINPKIIRITGLNDKGMMSVEKEGGNGVLHGENNRHLAIYVQLTNPGEVTMVDDAVADSGLLIRKITGAKQGKTKIIEETAFIKKPGILSIKNGQRISEKVMSIRVRLDSRLTAKLWLDKQEISANRIGYTQIDKESGTTLYSYVGVPMGVQGTHFMTLEGKGPFGNIRFSKQIEFVKTGEITTIRAIQVDGNIADGKTSVKVKLELLDINGDKVEADLDLVYKEGSLIPYKPKQALPLLQQDVTLIGLRKGGIISFAPVSNSGKYHAKLVYNNINIPVEVYVKPHYRDWIMVGLVEGSVGYRAVTGNQQNLEASELSDNYYSDGRIRFYAKGKVLGKYLLTTAYNSKKLENSNANSLFGTIDPNKYYSLYGDSAELRNNAASRDKLYIKLESDQFYAMYGDFDSGLNVTTLSKYKRRLTGLNGEYRSENIRVTGFVSDTNQAFIKDEILGDGTSGLYYLSRKNMVINSEKIMIETRDRFKSENIIKTQQLRQYLDYTIDPELGTIFFKAPVYRHDSNFNPIYIIAEYEVQNASQQSVIAGTRISVSLPEDRSEVGMTLVSDSTPGAQAELRGLDVSYRVNQSSQLRAEFATTSKTTKGTESAGDAYLLEFVHHSETVKSKVYVRQQKGDFSLGQQNLSESGTKKLGIDVSLQLTEFVSGRAEIAQETNLLTASVRQVINLSSIYRSNFFSVAAGIRHAQDKSRMTKKQESDLFTLGVKNILLERRLTLNLDATTESSLSDNSNSEYPTKIIVGGDYQINEVNTIFIKQEHTMGDTQDSNTTRLGIKSTPWANTRIQSSVEEQSSRVSGNRTFITTGLTQRVNFSKQLQFDAGIDRTKTIRSPGASRINSNVPLASGTVGNDFTAMTGGLTYTQKLWSITSRLEYRSGEQYDKIGLLLGMYQKSNSSIGLAYTLRHFTTKRNNNDTSITTNLALSIAYRPLANTWIVFNKFVIRNSEEKTAQFRVTSSKFINNITANYVYNRNNQLAFHYAVKRVNDTLRNLQYSGYTQLLDFEFRHDLNSHWDVGVQAGVLLTSAGDKTNSIGISVGVALLTNLWVSMGFNISGFEDNDFNAAGFTSQGVYMKFRYSLDHVVARRTLAWWENRKL